MSSLLFLVSAVFWELDGAWSYSLFNTSNSEGHEIRSLEIQKSLDQLTQRDSWELVSSISARHPENSFSSGFHRKTNHNIPVHLNVQMRLHKLEYYFTSLKIFEEDCKLRLLCEIAKEPAKFSPLSSAFLDETRYNGEEKALAERLLTSNEGSQLLTYIEAVQRGHDRQECDIWAYRCPQEAESMINYESLLVWREISKWLTIKMVSKRS